MMYAVYAYEEMTITQLSIFVGIPGNSQPGVRKNVLELRWGSLGGYSLGHGHLHGFLCMFYVFSVCAQWARSGLLDSQQSLIRDMMSQRICQSFRPHVDLCF